MNIRWGGGEVGEGEVVPDGVMDCFAFTYFFVRGQ